MILENTLRSIVTLSTDIGKYYQWGISEFVVVLTQKVASLFKVEKAKILIWKENSSDLIEYYQEESQYLSKTHDSWGSLAKQVVETGWNKLLVNRTLDYYNECVDLETSLPILWIPILNPYVDHHSEYSSEVDIPPGVPNKRIIGVLEIANPQALLMEYSLILKDIDNDALNKFLKISAYTLLSLISSKNLQ